MLESQPLRLGQLSRRRFLGGVATAATLAGCSGGGDAKTSAKKTFATRRTSGSSTPVPS